MNSSEYTICNLDSQTYITRDLAHFGQQENGVGGSGGAYPHGAAFNGLGDTAQYPYHPSPTLHHPGNAHNGVSSLPLDISPHSQGQNCNPLHYESGGVISHTGQVNYGGYHQAQAFSPYYAPPGAGLMPNGCVTPDLPGSPAYPSPYPDHIGYSHGALMHPQCTTGGYLTNGHAQSGQQSEGAVATYKWMTVKRAQPKNHNTAGRYRKLLWIWIYDDVDTWRWQMSRWYMLLGI